MTALARSRGKVAGANGAAAKLGIPASTLESKIRQLKIEKLHRSSELGGSARDDPDSSRIPGTGSSQLPQESRKLATVWWLPTNISRSRSR